MHGRAWPLPLTVGIGRPPEMAGYPKYGLIGHAIEGGSLKAMV